MFALGGYGVWSGRAAICSVELVVGLAETVEDHGDHRGVGGVETVDERRGALAGEDPLTGRGQRSPVVLGGQVRQYRLELDDGLLIPACGGDHGVDQREEFSGHAGWGLFAAVGQGVEGALDDRGVDRVQAVEEVEAAFAA